MKILRYISIFILILTSLSACNNQEENEVVKQQKRLLSQKWQVNNVKGSDLFNFKGESVITFSDNGQFSISSPFALPRISNGAHEQIALPAEGNWKVNEQHPEEITLYTESCELNFIVSVENSKLSIRYDAAEPRPHDVFEATLLMNLSN